MRTDADLIQRAILAVCTGAVKLTGVYTAADRFVHLLHSHAITSFSFFVCRLAFAGVYRACEVIVRREENVIQLCRRKSFPLFFGMLFWLIYTLNIILNGNF